MGTDPQETDGFDDELIDVGDGDSDLPPFEDDGEVARQQPADAAPRSPASAPTQAQDVDPDMIDPETGKPYGARVQDRIRKMRAKQGEVERDAAAKVAAEAARAEQAERRAREAEEKLAAAQGHVATFVTERVDRELADIRAQLKAAVEDGDVDKQIELQEKQQEKLLEKRWLVANAQRRQQAQQAGEPQKSDTPAREVPADVPKAAKEWGERVGFSRWNPALQAVAFQVEAKLSTERSDIDSPAYWQEVETRTRAAVEEIKRQRSSGQDRPDQQPPQPPVQQRPQPTSPVAAPNRGAAGQGTAAPSRRITLTRDQVTNMRRFGMDPGNKSHVETYLRENP